MNIVDIADYRVTSGQESDTLSDVQIIEKLLSMVRSLQTCEKWLQGQVASLQAEIERLRLAIRRLAEQDATLSVQGGNVTVTMDATLTDAERQAIAWAVRAMRPECRAVLQGLLERTK